MKASEPQEMYLLTIARLAQSGAETPIPLARVAEELSVLPVSANEMVRKLGKEGYLRYIPYKGVELLAKGIATATSVLRRRLLWEVFLVDKLGMNLKTADELACRLEHVTPAEAVDRLEAFLDHPHLAPDGTQIPTGNGSPILQQRRSLASAHVGESLEIVCINSVSVEQSFFESTGLHPGTVIRVMAIGGRGDVLLQIEDQQVHITHELVESIFVSAAAPMHEGIS